MIKCPINERGVIDVSYVHIYKNWIPLTSGLHDAFKDDYDLKLLIHERTLRQIKERALGVDLMADGQRRH